MTRSQSLALLSLALAACGDKGDGPSAVNGFDPRLRGIYTIEAHTMNHETCEAGGEAVADQHALFAIDTIDYQGRYFLGALSCADADMCRSHLAASQAPDPGDQIPQLDVDFFFLFASSRSDGSASAVAEGAALIDGMCVGRVYDDRLTREGERVRIESRIADVPPFEPNATGGCPLPAGSRDLPCNAFELVTGVLSGEL
jgi:hypothetical protein